MNWPQRIIQYLALGFAFFLVVGILSGIFYGVSMIGKIFHDDDFSWTEELEADARLLDIDLTSSNLLIKTGDTFEIENENPNIDIKEEGNQIFIKEKRKFLFGRSTPSNLVVSIPQDMQFDGIIIDSGSGKVEMGQLSTQILYLDLGAGQVIIRQVNVFDHAFIDGGAGEVNVQDSLFHDLEVSMGVGKFYLNAKLVGNSSIDHGVGEAFLSFIGKKEEYQIQVDKGLGTFTIQEEEVRDNTVYGSGFNKIDIDGGVGSIHISFQEE